MTPDVEDVTSSWLDSLDKGAGWGAGDGPISDMSAKGVTGNLLPNQNEVGGRSGEGRTGRSHGQMVGDTAEGKGGRETPTRLDPEPFEQGSVKDTAKNDPGGATGGGKLSGFGAEGLRGPAPPSSEPTACRGWPISRPKSASRPKPSPCNCAAIISPAANWKPPSTP